MTIARRLFVVSFLITTFATTQPSFAQEADDDDGRNEPAFTLSSSEVFTTKESAAFNLTFRQITQLDFRVYRVRDAFTFFAGLRDPHQLGSEERPVPQERSRLERFAAWKSGQRSEIRSFFRGQVTREYRVRRRDSEERKEIAQRVTLNETSFAQVPLLNPDQLVTAWRELLPDIREAELRRVPLDIKEPGVYLVEAVSGVLRAYTIVIVSDIGLVTKVAPGQILMFAADRHSGEPQPGCDVRVLADQKAIGDGKTGADGTLTLTLPDGPVDHIVGVVRCGAQVAATDPGGWFASEPLQQLVGYIYTDKPIYRPGHTVHVKAVLRWRRQDALVPFDQASAEIAVSDLNDKVIVRETLKPDAFGAVHASFLVPMSAALGSYNIRITSGDQQANSAFEVQEYRRPEFEVIVTPAARFVVQGQDAVATVQARYYFGQPVANARVRYVVNQQSYYSPLRWNDGGDGEDEGGEQYWYGDDQKVEGELRLDAQGRGEIRVPLSLDEQRRDYSVRIEAQVMDASSREVAGNTVMHATYGSYLITSRVGGSIFRPGQAVPVTIRAVDYTSAPQAAVPVTAVLERLTYPEGRYSEPTVTEVARATATTGADGAGVATLTLPNQAGSFRVRTSAQAGDREVSVERWLWIPGPQDGAVEEGDRYLELMSDKRTYAPGETARLIVRGEPVSGPMLVTKEGQQVTWHRVIRPAATDAIEVPIDAADIGDIYVHVAFMRDGRLYRAERRLSVPAAERALQITVTADSETAKPQEPGVFTVNVVDATGAPVQAQVSLGVIDEAVYAIRADDTPDPLRFFYRREYSRVGTMFSRDYYFTGFSGSEHLQLASRRRRPFTLADFKGDKQVQPQVRKDFPDAIYWIGDLVTDANGRGRVAIKYPDALTTWRLTARAITRDTRAGTSIARTTTTKDLIVRIVTPRFLTEGDQVVLPTIAHNYLQDDKETTVTFAAKGLEPAEASGLTTASGAIATGGERRNDWRFRAPTVGTAVVTATARTDTDVDAVELSVPVLPYGLRRETGASGTLNGTAEHSLDVTIPAASNPTSRVVSVAMAPSLAGSLLGALDFLNSYPYGCTEQTLSSFIPNLMVTRALAQLKIAPTERLNALDRQVAQGLQRLGDYQHDDGGWGWWKTDDNHPFMTAYAVYGLIEAKRAGYQIDEGRLESGAGALATLYAEFPRAEPDLKAYMAYVLRRSEVATASVDLTPLWDARAHMSAYGRALLLLALDDAKDSRGDELARALAGEAQTKGDLTWWISDRDPLLFDIADTSVEATATALRALARRNPTDPLVDRAIRWLMLNRRGGYWATTKQTAMALYGLLEVMQARNERPETFAVEVFVNGASAGTRTFTPASITAPDPIVITAAAREGTNTVRLVKKGGGTLYWSSRGTYYDTQGAQARSGSRQLAITRNYARLVSTRVKNRLVYREEPFDGRMNPGDVLSVRLTVAGSRDWRYLMIEDPLPAGVEAVPDTTAYPMEREDRWRWWWGSQVEYRDNRTLFFQEEFQDGRYEFVYLVKAVASGEFRAMPAQVSPMYVPDVTASSEPQTVIVSVPVAGSPQ
ncbi:MAG TPA: MG2 domain-containing protein [Vicinamibacterales bacterium]|nr:MG2 domain-containing protein [Vicinamibacterales bacterium]